MCVCVSRVARRKKTETGLIKESNYCKCQINGGVLLISILELTKNKACIISVLPQLHDNITRNGPYVHYRVFY